MRLRPLGQELFEQDQQPAGSAADKADVLLQRQCADAPDLLLPVADEAQRPRREIEGPHPSGRLPPGDAADIAAENAGRLLREVGAAAEQEALAVEHAAAGPVEQVVDEDVQRRALVGADHLARAGDVFDLAGGRSRGDGEIGDLAGPGAVGQYREACFPVALPELAVGAHRHPRLVIGDIGDVREVMVGAEAGPRRGAHQLEQLVPLGRHRIEARHRVLPPARIEAQERRRRQADAGGGDGRPCVGRHGEGTGCLALGAGGFHERALRS